MEAFSFIFFCCGGWAGWAPDENERHGVEEEPERMRVADAPANSFQSSA